MHVYNHLTNEYGQASKIEHHFLSKRSYLFGWDWKGRKQYYYTFGLFRINHNLAYTYEWDLQNKIGNASLIREAIIYQVVTMVHAMKYGDTDIFSSFILTLFRIQLQLLYDHIVVDIKFSCHKVFKSLIIEPKTHQ